jgi:hypothetical protein
MAKLPKLPIDVRLALIPKLLALVAEAWSALADDGTIDAEERERLTARFWDLVAAARG